MQNLIIYSDFLLHNSVTAAGNRMAKYAKAIANENCSVYILSKNCDFDPNNPFLKIISKNCWYVGIQSENRVSVLKFFSNIIRFSNSLTGSSKMLFYPSNNAFMDWTSLFYLKIFHKKEVFIEINERRIFYKDISVFKGVKNINIPQVTLKFLYTKISMRISEILVRYFNGMIFISRNIENYFKPLLKSKKSIRIPILCEPIDSKQNLSLYNESDVFQIGFSGQIRIHKENLDLLLNALNTLKIKGYKVRLNLYGPNIEAKQIKNYIEQLELNKDIIFHGNINYSQLNIELKSNHLLVIARGKTPQNHYGFSTKLSDYLSSGIPVLATRVSDVDYFMKDNYNGFLIEPDSENEITKKLEYIINSYNDISSKIVNQAFQLINNEFSYFNYSGILQSFLFKD